MMLFRVLFTYCFRGKSPEKLPFLLSSFGKAETSLLIKPAASVPLLNVSFPPWTAVLICSIEFVTTNSMFKNIHGRIFLNAPALYFRLTPCIYAVYLQKRWRYGTSLYLLALFVKALAFRQFCTRVFARSYFGHQLFF